MMLIAAGASFLVAFVFFALGASRAAQTGRDVQLMRRLYLGAGAASALAGACFTFAS